MSFFLDWIVFLCDPPNISPQIQRLRFLCVRTSRFTPGIPLYKFVGKFHAKTNRLSISHSLSKTTVCIILLWTNLSSVLAEKYMLFAMFAFFCTVAFISNIPILAVVDHNCTSLLKNLFCFRAKTYWCVRHATLLSHELWTSPSICILKLRLRSLIQNAFSQLTTSTASLNAFSSCFITVSSSFTAVRNQQITFMKNDSQQLKLVFMRVRASYLSTRARQSTQVGGLNAFKKA